jgi:predicted amidohydrolase YtcJ
MLPGYAKTGDVLCLHSQFRDSDEYAQSMGTISPGKRADLILIDRDVLTDSPDEMRAAKILWTMVAGKTVYRAPL